MKITTKQIILFEYLSQWIVFIFIISFLRFEKEYQSFIIDSAVILHSVGYFFIIIRFLLKKEYENRKILNILEMILFINFIICYIFFIFCIFSRISFPPLYFFVSSFNFALFYNWK